MDVQMIVDSDISTHTVIMALSGRMWSESDHTSRPFCNQTRRMTSWMATHRLPCPIDRRWNRPLSFSLLLYQLHWSLQPRCRGSLTMQMQGWLYQPSVSVRVIIGVINGVSNRVMNMFMDMVTYGFIYGATRRVYEWVVLAKMPNLRWWRFPLP